MDPNSSMAKIDAAGLLPGAEPLCELVYRQCGTDGPIRMICLLVRSAEKCQHGVADEFGNHAAIVKDRPTHTFEIVVANGGQKFGLDGFAERRKAGDIGEQYRK